MELRNILLSALNLGALYAASSIALSLIWGSFGMLNLAHGAVIAVGAYSSLLLVQAGFPWWSGIIGGAAGGLVAGAIIHFALVRWVFGRPNFEINIIILTMGVSSIVVDGINNFIGPNTNTQPFHLDGRLDVGGSGISYQTLLAVASFTTLVLGLQFILNRTDMGRAIRAVALEPVAAQLNGLPVQTIVLKILMLAGAIAGASGVLLTAMSSVYPTVGYDPMLKALIVCVVGGLGSIPGSLIAAFGLALLETAVQFELGTRWGMPALLIATVVVVIVRPNGLMGQNEVVRS
jgi:branched-subunit amino acid ABC-type transport system permease component